MKGFLSGISTAALLLFTLGIATTVYAQATASDAYMQYRKALSTAKKVDDIFPFISANMKKQVEATPAEQRGVMFDMMKMMSDEITNLKVVKETRTAAGATVTVEGTGSDKSKNTGTITMVTENGGFKIDKESWTNK
jgi:hypothetical protein